MSLRVGDIVKISCDVEYPSIRGLQGRIGAICEDYTALVEIEGHWNPVWGAWPIRLNKLEKPNEHKAPNYEQKA